MNRMDVLAYFCRKMTKIIQWLVLTQVIQTNKVMMSSLIKMSQHRLSIKANSPKYQNAALTKYKNVP